MNKLFSERYGYVVQQVQFEKLDRITKNFLWEALYIDFWVEVNLSIGTSKNTSQYKAAETLLLRIDRHIFHNSILDRPSDLSQIVQSCQNMVLNSSWYFSFDIIEFVAQNSRILFNSDEDYDEAIDKFTRRVNDVLEKHKAMYRLVELMIVPITNEAELSTISTALEATESYKTVDTHIIKALNFLSDRVNPDYHNSIKESTSALEAIVRLIAHMPNGTLPDALKQIKKREMMSLNPNLEQTIKSLFNWASDEGGIRHADKGTDSVIDLDDAKFTIVTCCSLVNYLMAKATKAGIDLAK